MSTSAAGTGEALDATAATEGGDPDVVAVPFDRASELRGEIESHRTKVAKQRIHLAAAEAALAAAEAELEALGG